MSSLSDIPVQLWLALLALLALAWRLAATSTGRGNTRRARTAAAAEHHAESVLAAAGYHVVERQVTAKVPLRLDGVLVEASCRADLIVRRRRKHYVAEVKSGERVTDPTHPSTRRQLLEYLLVFDVEGVLLVDMHHETVIEVEFPAL